MVNLAERPPLFASALLFKLAAGGLLGYARFRTLISRLVKDGTTSWLKEPCVGSIYKSSGF